MGWVGDSRNILTLTGSVNLIVNFNFSIDWKKEIELMTKSPEQRKQETVKSF